MPVKQSIIPADCTACQSTTPLVLSEENPGLCTQTPQFRS
jgi:hypothetical protein